MNRTLIERVRSMIFNVGLGKKFWAKIVNTACHLVNRSPTTSIEYMTPEEVWSSKPADYSNLRVFGCPAYTHVNEGKLEPRSKKYIFLGYPENVKGYKLWCPESSKFFNSRDVIFNESAMLKTKKVALKPTIKENEMIAKKVEFEVLVREDDEAMSHDDANSEECQEEVQPYALASDRARREVRPPTRYGYSDFAYCLAITEDVEYSEPSSCKEAISSKDAVNWVAAMNEELQFLQQNETWFLMKPSSGKRIVGCK